MKPLLFSLAIGAIFFLPQAFAQSPTATASPASHGLDTPSAVTAPVSPSGPATTSTTSTTTAMPSEAEMMKQMMELSKLNENHKLIGDMAGNWNYTVKMWMAPGAPPMESKGTAVRKPILGGRYYTFDVTGTMKMPGEDGKLKDFTFKGNSIEGYDNTKKKFIASWIDNMGTGMMFFEGDYDAATKTFTYTSEAEMMPGMKVKVREVLKIADKNNQVMEWYEDRGGQEMKTMEIDYHRAK